jgi:hypothetical protein
MTDPDLPGPRYVDALMALRFEGRGVGLAPADYDDVLQREFAKAIKRGDATITPEGRVRITPAGIRAEDREWGSDD